MSDEVFGQLAYGFTFEEQSLWQQAERLFQLAGQFHHQHGINAVFLQRGLRINLVRRQL